jgi:hypothetical protein
MQDQLLTLYLLFFAGVLFSVACVFFLRLLLVTFVPTT